MESYEPKDLFNEAKQLLNLVGGTLNIDDSTLDKPYSQHMELVSYFWSGKHHRVVKGLNLVTLYYTDLQEQSLPVNYRVYDKAEGKTKNDYFRDMLAEVLDWGLQPSFMTGDSWYSCVRNLNPSLTPDFKTPHKTATYNSKKSRVALQTDKDD